MGKTIHETVKDHYGSVVTAQRSCCGPSCDNDFTEQAQRIGYSEKELQSIPDEANLGLGCGNPLAHAEINPGDTVLDLGSGAGVDCFLAAQVVGPDGLVIGVDMTPEMIKKAEKNKQKVGLNNVDFRPGTIENLPVDSNSVNLVISNCVINLSPDKQRVFQESFRVLKPGGLLLVSDIVLLKKLPRSIRNSVEAYVGCIAGASQKSDYLNFIRNAGYGHIEIVEERKAGELLPEDGPILQKLLGSLPLTKGRIKRTSNHFTESIKVRAVKPLLEPS